MSSDRIVSHDKFTRDFQRQLHTFLRYLQVIDRVSCCTLDFLSFFYLAVSLGPVTLWTDFVLTSISGCVQLLHDLRDLVQVASLLRGSVILQTMIRASLSWTYRR